MSAAPLRCTIVTPARNEAANLRRLAACVIAQTLRPSAWVIVDDGSTDGTPAVARELAARHEWVRVVTREGAVADDVAGGRRAGRPLLAFRAGVDAGGTAEIVVKLDADVTMDPDHFGRLVAAFADDPALGMASGGRWEWVRGRWRRQYLTGTSVEAQCRAYRARCLDEALPHEPRFYWDGIDEVKANVCGWRTAVLGELEFRHHRPMGARDGSRRRSWAMEGRGSHYMGYRPSYLSRWSRATIAACRQPCVLGTPFETACTATSTASPMVSGSSGAPKNDSRSGTGLSDGPPAIARA